jgi:hypothetical protein
MELVDEKDVLIYQATDDIAYVAKERISEAFQSLNKGDTEHAKRQLNYAQGMLTSLEYLMDYLGDSREYARIKGELSKCK